VSDDPDAVIPFLSLTAPVAPMAEAALLLHGRRAWGAEWFENTCYLRYGQLPPALIPTQRAS
jgi:hypothetical protein